MYLMGNDIFIVVKIYLCHFYDLITSYLHEYAIITRLLWNNHTYNKFIKPFSKNNSLYFTNVVYEILC